MLTHSSETAQYRLYNRLSYYRELAHKINGTKPGDRIAIATMSVEPLNGDTHHILEALNQAADRGVHVSFTIDAYGFLGDRHLRPGPLFFHTRLPARLSATYQPKLDALNALASHGGRYAITNQPGRRFTRQVAGRSHVKFAVVNDWLYVGGCELNTINQIDLMVGWQDRLTADWLYDIAQAMVTTAGTAFLGGKDVVHQIDNHSQLLIDAGQPGYSTIFNKALAMIDEAQQTIYFTSQYPPYGSTLNHLKRARARGVRVTIVYNHPDQHAVPINLILRLIQLRARLHAPATLFSGQLDKRRPFLHAKLLATDLGAIVGSHNLAPTGVKVGTAEIALLCRDPAFAQKAIATIEHELRPDR